VFFSCGFLIQAWRRIRRWMQIEFIPFEGGDSSGPNYFHFVYVWFCGEKT
jgi:hypothetical protein